MSAAKSVRKQHHGTEQQQQQQPIYLATIDGCILVVEAEDEEMRQSGFVTDTHAFGMSKNANT